MLIQTLSSFFSNFCATLRFICCVDVTDRKYKISNLSGFSSQHPLHRILHHHSIILIFDAVEKGDNAAVGLFGFALDYQGQAAAKDGLLVHWQKAFIDYQNSFLSD